ncbi:unnamed protein product [Caenorhabditis angaria]|uniref:Tudor domain-containing protein n=1 Tax=Caenorhabditis angaria TaxID=860376 RepID=A0A9P1IG97_9PELO|nr:unnamed protein product [Caenorhabditis angaria]
MSYNLWHDTYDLAFRMYNDSVATHRSDLDVLDISVADKSAQLIGFDPFTGNYELLIMQADLNTPINSLVRDLAECDIEEIRKNQKLANGNHPKVITVKLLHALPPLGLIIFNCEYKKSIDLEKELQNHANKLKPALIGDIFPGAILLRKQNDKLYRVMIVGQVGDIYNIILVDHAMKGFSRLEKLFLLNPELDLSNFPCALMICRIRGFRKLNKSAFNKFKNDIDKHGPKERVKAVVFKQDEDNNMVIDFGAVSGAELTASEELSIYMNDDGDENDPELISLSDIQNMQNSSIADVQMDTETSNNPARVFDPPTQPTRPASVSSIIGTKLRLPPPSPDMNSSNAPKPKVLFGIQSISNFTKDNLFPKKTSVFGIQSEKPSGFDFVAKHSFPPKPLPLFSNSVKDPSNTEYDFSAKSNTKSGFCAELNTESGFGATSTTQSSFGTKNNTEAGFAAKLNTESECGAKSKIVTFSNEIVESSPSNVHSSIDLDESPSMSPKENELNLSMSCPNGVARIEQLLTFHSSGVPTSVPVLQQPVGYDEGDESDTELLVDIKETTNENSTRAGMESEKIPISEEQDSIERSMSIPELHSPTRSADQSYIPNVSSDLSPFETHDGVPDLQKDDFKVLGNHSIVKSPSDEDTVQEPESSEIIEKKEESVKVEQVCPIRNLKEIVEEAIRNHDHWNFYMNMLTILKNFAYSKSEEESEKWKDLIQFANKSFADSINQA